MTSQLRKTIMKRSRLNLANKANKSGKPADNTAYKKQRNLVVKSNKEAKKAFLKNKITEKAANKTKIFWKLCKASLTKKVFIRNRNLLLKLKEV